ncbi:MAG: hypothetical protein N2321_07510 [Melioribacteraceae bacterium]|nr:hypothetical protein [Melioribacteraceae bacterium]
MKKLIVLLLSIIISNGYAQNIGINFTGFVKTDIFYDSRQTISLREGHFLLYPQNEKLDANNADVNAKSNFNILSIQSRLLGKITGPDAFGAKTSGQIEAEFFGTNDADINGFRLRHAFVKFDWENSSLLVGQTWHPLFISEMFPSVVSFNTGAPFQPFGRNPQIRLTHSFDNIKLILTAASQRDFSSNGPDGFSSSYLRNSVIPNINTQIQYLNNNNLIGIGLDYKKITPRVVTTKNLKTDNSLPSISLTGYAKYNKDLFTLKSQLVYGSNLADLMMLGGYAVKFINPNNGFEEYTSIKVLSVWGELIYGKEIEYGIFAGYSKNLGADDKITGPYYGRATNIDNLLRISPRIQLNSNKARFSTEVEYTVAAYGKNDNNNNGKVIDAKNISNLRLLFAVYYFF